MKTPAQGSVITAIVTKSYSVRGRAYADVIGPGLGPTGKTGVPVSLAGGGSRRRFLHMPPDNGGIDAGAEVVLAFRTNRQPVIIGVLGFVGSDISDTPITGEADDLEGIDVNTAALVWDEAKVSTRGGKIALEPASGGNINAQLQGQGTMRVSLDGEASDSVPVTSQTVALINALIAKINAQDVQIAVLTAAVATLSTGVPLAGVYVAEPLPTASESQIGAKAISVSGQTRSG